MLSLKRTAAMELATSTYPDNDLKQLLAQRMETLRRHYDGNLEEIVHFLVVEPGDTPREVEAELGWSPLRNREGVSFRDPAFTPDWEFIQCDGRWFSLTYVLEDGGFGWIVFVANDPGTEFDLLSLCLAFTCYSRSLS